MQRTNTMQRRRQNSIFPRRHWTAGLLFAIAMEAACSSAWGAPDDFEVEARAKDASGPNIRGNMIVDQLTVEQMESWVFQSAGNNREGWIKSCEGGL